MKRARQWLALLGLLCAGVWFAPYARAMAEPQPRARMQKLIFDVNGGKCNTAWDLYTIGEPYTSLPRASLDGYVFAGWYTEAEGGTQVTVNDTVTADAERTVYAHWKPSDIVGGILWTYTVTDGEVSIGTGRYAGDRAVSPSTSGAVTVPSKLGGYPVTAIADYAFYGCTGLTSVKVPSGVRRIGRYAFSGCLQLATLTLPESVEEVGEYAFNACPVLKTAVLPEKVGTVVEGLFSNCERLETVKLPSGTKEIGESAFYRCGALREVAVPAGVTNIGRYAFFECVALKAAEIPDGVRVVEPSTFEGCRNLERVRLPAGLTTIGSRAFKGCGKLAALEIPSGVTVLGTRALEECTGLPSVRVPEGIRSVRTRTFAGCSALRRVELASGVVRIGEGAFSKCGNMELPAPERKHYRFEGWWTAADGGSMVVSTNWVSGTERELFAHWSPETYAIRFHANGGDGTMADQTFAYGSPVTLCSNAFRRAKWEFAGWAVETGGEAVYADGERVDLTGVDDATVELYAVWSKVALPEIGGEEEVAGELAEAADGRLAEKIRTADGYADFRAWALAVKDSEGHVAGAKAVMSSAHAWASYVLGAETLFANEPEIRIEEIAAGGADGARNGDGREGAITVRVAVRDGEEAAAVDAAKVAGLFAATADLDDWTGEGLLPVSAAAKGTEGDSMVFEVEPATGGGERLFLRIAE